MNNQLRDYQKTGSDFIVSRNGRALLADEAGSGKSLTALNTIHQLKNATPVLIFSIKPGLYVWYDELRKWFNEEAIIYSGNPKQRNEAWNKFKSSQIDYLITNYAFINEVKDPTGLNWWKTIIMDEYHIMGISNHRTQRFKAIKSLARQASYLIMVTGSPLRRNLSNLYAPFNLLDPKEFPSFWRFVGKYCIVTEDYFGKTIEEMPRDIEKFIKVRKKYMIRRLKKDIMPELPSKTRQPISVWMTPKQAELYHKMDKDMYCEYGDKFVVAKNNAVKLLRLRQLLVTPMIFGIPIAGGALEALIELVAVELSNGNPVAIFTPFREAIPQIKQMLTKGLGKPPILFSKLVGGMTAKAIKINITTFQNSKTTRKIFLGTIKSGMAITLTTAKVCFFVGYEWTSEENSQAENRLHRHGQRDNVRALYLLHRDNDTDEKVRQILNSKQRAINWVLKPEEMLSNNDKIIEKC